MSGMRDTRYGCSNTVVDRIEISRAKRTHQKTSCFLEPTCSLGNKHTHSAPHITPLHSSLPHITPLPTTLAHTVGPPFQGSMMKHPVTEANANHAQPHSDMLSTSPTLIQPLLPEQHDGVSSGKYVLGLGQVNMAVCDTAEDATSMALTAVRAPLHGMATP